MAAEGSNPLSHVVQHSLGTIEVGGHEYTLMSDHISMLLTAGILLSLFLPMTFRRKASKGEIGHLVPTGFRNGIEAICAYFRDEIARPNLGEHTDRFIKYIWTVFFFVLALNLLGLMPIAAVSTLFGTHLGGTATANIWVTATLAICTLLMMVVNGLRFGGVEYLKHFMPGPLWLAPLMIVVELIGLIAKAFALAIRLFANMVAGHTLMAVLMSFIISAGSASAVMGFTIAIPVVLGSTAISMLEIFVAFLQAFIFAFLTTLFIGQSVNLHHDDHHEEAHA